MSLVSLDQAWSPAYRIPHARSSSLVRRRIATHFTGGVDGVHALTTVLRQQGCKVHELSVDVGDGVRESSMLCTVMMPTDDVDALLERLRRLPSVVSSELI